jgi:uncharacterized GH25 family protein
VLRFFSRPAAVCLLTLAISSPELFAQRQAGPGPQAGQDGGGRGRQSGAPAVRDEGGRGRTQQRTGTASIRGRVINAATGTPVRRAAVSATVLNDNGRSEGARNGQTDDNGAFEFRNLFSGRWTLRATKPGYIDQQFGQRSAFATTDPIVLVDGQQFVADFRLVRGGAIAGLVLDEFGDPLAGANVTALRIQNTAQGIRTTRTGTSVPSDDNGAYRIYNLPPGQYLVAVNDPSAGRMIVFSPDGNVGATMVGGEVTLVSETRTSYAPTYYPGTVALADAQRITLSLGEQQSGINLSVIPARAARIAGRVMGSNGQAIRANISLQSQNGLGQAFSPSGGRNGSGTDGTFTLTNIPPGSYLLNVLGPNVGTAPPEVASMPLVVDGSDITGLTIVTGSGAAIQGTVVSDNGMKLPDARIRVTAVALDNSQVTGGNVTNGTFELVGLLGVFTFRFESLPAGWTVKSVTANGIDISDTAAEFRPADRISMRVELTDRVTQVTGTVRSDRVVKGGTVVVFADDPSKWTGTSRFIKTARLTESGQFTVSGLPPHQRYLAVAVDFIEPGEPQSPDFLQRAKTAASASFSLSAGDQKILELPLVVR